MLKYTEQTFLPALRLFVSARAEAVSAGFTDNGGAIHSGERILDILSQRGSVEQFALGASCP